MTEQRNRENGRLPDYEEISNHILPAQYNLPFVAIGKNADGIDEPDDLSYLEGQNGFKKEQENPRS
ncbi:hypothetical protein FGG79_07665 [Bacillus sp. BHET2]|uniref:hypothetical protein n=1 Tax=Bacillus sp. BHET2 TaxID=2583818 RepID=UPI00110EA4A2|nr:hypothetical protein [Bacillus sp. BHET2]TMU87976.1 hypothetical protein FGG79_07665 [Bacillus sp. BHET2]